MKPQIRTYQEKVLKALEGKIDDFCLGGGTALSLFYFRHRESLDLDFFTSKFSKIRVLGVINLLSLCLKKKVVLVGEQAREDMIKLLIFSISISKNDSLKIDFIQDYLGLVKQPKIVNGIKVFSLEDIYIRKIFAIAGTLTTEDLSGKPVTKGGRQEAKDFYDLYCLSITFMRLSDFCFKYCNQTTREAIIRWFRTYDRFDIKTGLLDLKLKKDVDYKDLEAHFKKEIGKIIEKEIEAI